MILEYLHDKEAERQVVGSILIAPDTLDEVEFLAAEDFYSTRFRLIYEAMQVMRERHDPIDYLSVESYLRVHGTKDITCAQIGSLTDGVYAVNAAGYARKVQERARARRMHATLHELGDRLERGDPPQEVSQELLDAAELGGNDKIQVATLGSAMNKLEAYQTGRVCAYTLTGLDALDKYPAASNELVVIAGRPSMGKTALGIYMAERLSLRGLPTSFLSIEMAGDDVQFRRIASLARVPMVKMRMPNGLTDWEWEHVGNTLGRMKEAQLEILSGRFTLPDLVVSIRQAKARRAVKAVFIDHLGLIVPPEADRHDLALGKITSALSRLAKDQDVTIYLLHQLNRGSERREDPHPTMADLRNSGEIEQDADGIWLLYRRNYYDPDAGPAMEINVAKNRNGPTGLMEVDFNKETGRIDAPQDVRSQSSAPAEMQEGDAL
jgi:replicative DNA helicase